MTYYTIFSAISMPKPPKIRQILLQLKSQLAKLSFRTGLWVLAGCAVSYLWLSSPCCSLFSHDQGVLWFIFFGLAKTLQYTALLILGKEGAHRIRDWWRERKRKSNFPE